MKTIFLCIAAAFITSQVLAIKLELGLPFVLEKNGVNLSPEINPLTICLSNINQARANNGKGPVADNAQVEEAAYNHNSWMVQNDCFSHQCPGEPGLGERLSATGYQWSGAGEILTAGPGDCIAAINSWLNSPPHKAIMLDDYTHVGCSSSNCTNCQYKTYWTCVFANTY